MLTLRPFIFAMAVVTLLTIRLDRAAQAAETAEELIAKGVELRKQGQHERALEFFRRAHAEEPSPRTIAQIGLAEQSLKRWTDSESHLATALQDTSHAWIRKNRAHLQNALDVVRSHIGHLTVQGLPGAAVYVQGEPKGTLPLTAPIRLGEGEVSLQVTAAGRQNFIRSVTIRAGEVATVAAQLEPASYTPEPPKPVETTPSIPVVPGGGSKDKDQPSTTWNRGKIAGVTLLGAGVLSIAAGATLLLIDKNETCDAPFPGAMCGRRNQTRVPGWSFIGAGVAAGALGGVLLYHYRNPSGEVALGASPSSLFVSGRF